MINSRSEWTRTWTHYSRSIKEFSFIYYKFISFHATPSPHQLPRVDLVSSELRQSPRRRSHSNQFLKIFFNIYHLFLRIVFSTMNIIPSQVYQPQVQQQRRRCAFFCYALRCDVMLCYEMVVGVARMIVWCWRADSERTWEGERRRNANHEGEYCIWIKEKE